MATIDDVVDKGRGAVGGAVEATKDYAVREVKHGFWDKLFEGTLAAIGAGVGYYLGAPFESIYTAIGASFIGLSVGYTTAQLTSLPINMYHNITSFFQYGKELIFGKKKTESPKSPIGSPQSAYAT